MFCSDYIHCYSIRQSIIIIISLVMFNVVHIAQYLIDWFMLFDRQRAFSSNVSAVTAGLQFNAFPRLNWPEVQWTFSYLLIEFHRNQNLLAKFPQNYRKLLKHSIVVSNNSNLACVNVIFKSISIQINNNQIIILSL